MKVRKPFLKSVIAQDIFYCNPVERGKCFFTYIRVCMFGFAYICFYASTFASISHSCLDERLTITDVMFYLSC